MEKLNTVVVVLLIITGLFGILLDFSTTFPGFYAAYSTSIELYLFIFSAFLVLKRIFFYRLKGNVEIVRIKEQSNRYNTLLVQGGLLVLLYIVYLRIYSDWLSVDTVMIGVLLLYYTGQVLANSYPAIYVDSRAFAFDDYFVEQWRWNEMENISIQQEKLKVKGKEKDFELDFATIDQMDNVKLSQEIDAMVLDGSFGEVDSSRVLINILESYATRYGVNHQFSDKPV